jgi:hypothetical protein
VNLIHKNDGALVVKLLDFLCSLNNFFKISNTTEDRIKQVKLVAVVVAKNLGQGSFSRARRTPKNETREGVALKEGVFLEDILLAMEALKIRRPYTVSQRAMSSFATRPWLRWSAITKKVTAFTIQGNSSLFQEFH